MFPSLDDEQEWSIHDLDHAPPPPEDTSESFRLSPRSRSRSEDILLQGGPSIRGRLFSGSSTASVLGSSGLVSNLHGPPGHTRGGSFSSNDDLLRRGTLFGSRGEPSRPRSRSTGEDLLSASARSQLRRSESSTSASSAPSHPLASVRSFPPHDRRVAFANEETRYDDTEMGMLSLPETEEEFDSSRMQQDPLAPVLSSSAFDVSGNRRRQDSHGTFPSDSSTSEGEQLEQDNDGDDSGLSRSRQPVFFLGIQMPLWLNKRPSWNRMAACVVTRAPCFWFSASRTPTDRSILTRLNVLLAFFSFFQVVSGVWLAIILLAPGVTGRDLEKTPLEEERMSSTKNRGLRLIANVWNINGTILVLCFIAFIIFLSAVLTLRVIRDVNLGGAIRYLWVLLWMLPISICLIIQLFDYFKVTNVWVRHWWRDPALAWFRREFCAPDTYNTLCAVPIITPFSNTTETEWCMQNYNATNCSDIRDKAQSDADKMLLTYYYCNAAWGLLLICVVRIVVVVYSGRSARQANRAPSSAAYTCCQHPPRYHFSAAGTEIERI